VRAYPVVSSLPPPPLGVRRKSSELPKLTLSQRCLIEDVTIAVLVAIEQQRVLKLATLLVITAATKDISLATASHLLKRNLATNVVKKVTFLATAPTMLQLLVVAAVMVVTLAPNVINVVKSATSRDRVPMALVPVEIIDLSVGGLRRPVTLAVV